MGTFLKYVFYAIVIVVLYLVGRGIYDGSINDQTTVGSVVEQVGEGSKELVKDGAGAVENALDDYQAAPKTEVEVAVPAAPGNAPVR